MIFGCRPLPVDLVNVVWVLCVILNKLTHDERGNCRCNPFSSMDSSLIRRVFGMMSKNMSLHDAMFEFWPQARCWELLVQPWWWQERSCPSPRTIDLDIFISNPSSFVKAEKSPSHRIVFWSLANFFTPYNRHACMSHTHTMCKHTLLHF